MAAVNSMGHVPLLFPTLEDQNNFLDEGSFDVALQQIQNQKILNLPRGVACTIADYIGPKNPINPCQLLFGNQSPRENYCVTGQIIQELAALILFNPEVSRERITHLANIQIYIIDPYSVDYVKIMGKDCFFKPHQPDLFDETRHLKKNKSIFRSFERRAHKIVRAFDIRVYAQENLEKQTKAFIVDTIGPKAYVRQQDLEQQNKSCPNYKLGGTALAAYALSLRDNFNPSIVENPPKVDWCFES